MPGLVRLKASGVLERIVNVNKEINKLKKLEDALVEQMLTGRACPGCTGWTGWTGCHFIDLHYMLQGSCILLPQV